jgi:hypothetical protein
MVAEDCAMKGSRAGTATATRQIQHRTATSQMEREREATASMATDSGIDEYVNTVMTIAESSGHGTVDAVVHRPPRDSEDMPHWQSRCAARCGGKAGVRHPQPCGIWH